MPPRGDYPSSKQDQYMLRFPDGMRDRLKAEAERNRRSMNQEIVDRLEASFESDFITGQQAVWDQMMQSVDRAVIDWLPQGLASRIEASAMTRGQTLEEEVREALLAAYPPPPRTDVLRQIATMIEQIETGDEPRADIPGYDSAAMRRNILDTLRRLADDPEGVVLVPGGIMYQSDEDDTREVIGSFQPAESADAPQGDSHANIAPENHGSGSRSQPSRKRSGSATVKPKP